MLTTSTHTLAERMVLVVWSIPLLLSARAHGAEPAALVTIAAPGNPPVIVVPAVMEDQVQYAVDDLRSYLQKITDLKLELAQGDAAGKFGIFVGRRSGQRRSQAGGREGTVRP